MAQDEKHPVAEIAKDIARAWGNKAWQIAVSHKPLEDRDMRTLLLEGKEAVRNLINADFVVAADELTTLRARLSSLEALLGEAREALEPMASFAEHFVDENGWTGTNGSSGRERINDWFGPSDFRRAAAVSAKIDAMDAAQENGK